MRLVKIGLMIILLILVTYSFREKLIAIGADVFPIKYVRIGGQFKHLDKAKIELILRPVVNSGFFTADLQVMQLVVSSLPWVESAEVKRVWPDTIEIRVYEQKPVARWGQLALLNKNGEVFTPVNVSSLEKLPVINGSSSQAYKLFEIMNKIKQELNENDLALAEFKVTERQSWHVILANGINLQLGRQQPIQKFRQFLKLSAVLGEDKLDLIKAVDMRYPNGVSIQWKPGTSIEWEQNNLSSKVSG